MNSVATLCWESWSLEIFHALENHNADDSCAQVCAHTRVSRVWMTIKRNFDSRHEQIHPLAFQARPPFFHKALWMASSRLSDASSHTGSLDKFAALSEEWLVWYAYMRIRVEIYIKEVALTNEKVEVNARNCRKSSRRGWRTRQNYVLCDFV